MQVNGFGWLNERQTDINGEIHSLSTTDHTGITRVPFVIIYDSACSGIQYRRTLNLHHLCSLQDQAHRYWDQWDFFLKPLGSKGRSHPTSPSPSLPHPHSSRPICRPFDPKCRKDLNTLSPLRCTEGQRHIQDENRHSISSRTPCTWVLSTYTSYNQALWNAGHSSLRARAAHYSRFSCATTWSTSRNHSIYGRGWRTWLSARPVIVQKVLSVSWRIFASAV